MLPNTYELDIGCIASELVIDRKHIDFNVELKLYQVKNIEIKNIPGDLLQTIPIAFKNCKILNCEFAYTDSCACLFFENCSFACEVNIHYGLMDFIKFLNCIFYKQFTICSIVEQKVDFSNSHFKDYVDFRACEFKKMQVFMEPHSIKHQIFLK